MESQNHRAGSLRGHRRIGVEEGKDGQQRPRASDIQASSQSLVAKVPCESGPQDASSQSVPGRSRPGSPLGLGVADEEAAVIPQDELLPLLPGPSGDVATTASRSLELYPFLGDPWPALWEDRKDET